MNASQKIIQARCNLVLDEPFFGTLALRLQLVEDSTCKTFWTNGYCLAFNPAYAESLSLAEVTGIICHEVLHVANGHPWRRDGRDMKLWNWATDAAINPIILSARMVLPAGVVIDPSCDGLSAEQIYERARQQPPSQGQTGNEGQRGQSEDKQPSGSKGEKPDQEREEEEPGQGKGDEGQEVEGDRDFGCGEVRDCEDEDAATQEAEWQVAVIQAAQAAKAQGKLPAGIERLVEEIRRPKIDWRAALRRFVQMCAKRDFTWRQPNRRYVASGLYLPALQSEQMPPMVIYWDTSGSRDYEEARAECATEIDSIIEEMKPEKTYIIYADAKIQRVDEFEPGEPVEFRPVGGGGTDFTKPFEWIEENDIMPACFIGITDLYGTFPKREPYFPVIWATTTNSDAPFGEIIKIHE